MHVYTHAHTYTHTHALSLLSFLADKCECVCGCVFARVNVCVGAFAGVHSLVGCSWHAAKGEEAGMGGDDGQITQSTLSCGLPMDHCP